jgi:hypothetical protein
MAERVFLREGAVKALSSTFWSRRTTDGEPAAGGAPGT